MVCRGRTQTLTAASVSAVWRLMASRASCRKRMSVPEISRGRDARRADRGRWKVVTVVFFRASPSGRYAEANCLPALSTLSLDRLPSTERISWRASDQA